MAIKVITDSSADLPPQLAEQWNVAVVPLTIHFGQKTYQDGVDLTPDEFYQRLTSSDQTPTTSQPSVGDFLRVYRPLTQSGDGLISIHISSKLSGTINSAVQAKAALDKGAPVEIVDSLHASMGLGLIVLAAARSAKAGVGLPGVLEEIRRAIAETHILFFLETLEYLHRGGRIGKAQALLGSLLGIRPILTLKEGEVHPVERTRTRDRAIQRLVEMTAELSPLQELCILHSTTPNDLETLQEKLSPLVPAEAVITSRFGPVIGTHVGPGALGVGVRRAR